MITALVVLAGFAVFETARGFLVSRRIDFLADRVQRLERTPRTTQ